jgi:hypothetical protein
MPPFLRIVHKALTCHDGHQIIAPTSLAGPLACPERRGEPLSRSSSPGSTGRPSIPETVVLEPRGHSVLDAPLSRSMTAEGRTRLFVLAARNVRAVETKRPRNLKRAQGRPGAHRTHGPRATKKHAAEPQVRADQPAFPAQWCYGLYVISPVTGLSCHRRSWIIPRTWRQRRGARTTRFRRPHTRRSSRKTIAPGDVRPSHPAPNVRDDREPPLFAGAGRARASF